MAKMKKIIVAGSLVKEVVYTIPNGRDPERVRGEKRKISSAAQKRMNEKYSWQKLEMILAANFVPGDLVVTLTYNDRNLPRSYEEDASKLKYFMAKMRKARKARGETFRMAWNDESISDSGRWHHHCVINGTSGEDYKELLRVWGNGEVEIKPLIVNYEKNYETLARYMCKEYSAKPGRRAWSYTRNCSKPEVECYRVPDDTPLQPPKGSMVFEDQREQNQFGSYHYVKYICGDLRAVSRRRRRKR